MKARHTRVGIAAALAAAAIAVSALAGQGPAQTQQCPPVPPHRADDTQWKAEHEARCALREEAARLARETHAAWTAWSAMDGAPEADREAARERMVRSGEALQTLIDRCGIPCARAVDATFAGLGMRGGRSAMASLAEVTAQAHMGAVRAAPNMMMAMTISGAAAPEPRFPDASPGEAQRVRAGSADQVSLDTDTGSWPLVRQRLRWAMPVPAQAVRPEEWVHWFEQGTSEAGEEGAVQMRVEQMAAPWNAQTRLVRVGVHAGSAPGAKAPLTIMWLVDRSGSMQGPERFGLVTSAMERQIGRLEAGAELGISAYAGAVEAVLEPTADRAAMRDGLRRLRARGAGGGTAGSAGIEHAIAAMRTVGADRRKVILIATDGDFNIGTHEPDKVERLAERCRRAGIELHVMLVGQDNVRDDIGQALAQAGNGRGYYADSIGEAVRVVTEQVPRPPAARDVKVRFEPNPATVAEFRRIGMETRVLSEEEFERADTDGGEIAAGNAASVWYEVVLRASPHRYLPRQTYGDVAAKGREGSEWATVTVRYRDAAGGAHEQAAKFAAQMQAGPQARWLAAVLWAAERMREGPAGGSSAWSAVYRYAEQGERGLATPEGRSARLELLDHLYLQEKQGG